MRPIPTHIRHRFDFFSAASRCWHCVLSIFWHCLGGHRVNMALRTLMYLCVSVVEVVA